ncbi:hypothetical protein CC78DRAFT_544390 [Lojkania enalia]|uniref:Secreted protein n=1 Tax=Lojkania enalia TaxID=147567 RepID=A0A9P4K7G3_9PLEO|nr:hypothetical protein CC78DRAFT_544390 [Didymosphaeria enalia]
MKNSMFTLLGALLMSGIAFGLPSAVSKDGELEVVYVDPHPHTIPAGDLALLNKTEGASGIYTPSGDFTPLEIQQGQLLTFNNGTLEKRSGNPTFIAYGSYGCVTGDIAGVRGFGCGQCIAWSGCGCGGALSALLSMDNTFNPKPTASLFTRDDCQGPYQSIGITRGNTRGCSDSEQGDFFSALVYYNC